MKNKRGIGVIFLIIIIVLILVIAGVTIFMVNKKDNNSLNNTQVSKSNQTSDEFFNGDYSLIYDVSSYSDQFWNSKNSIYSAMTNKEYFFNKYMSQVANQSSSTYGGNLAMPLKPDYTMHYRIYKGGGAEKTCEYFLKVEFNKEHIFYPNMMIGNLEGTNDSMFTFSILDNDMNFNRISGNFNHYMKTTKMKNENNSNYKLLYEDNEWAFFEVTGNNEKTTIYADYYVDLEKYDYINFTIKLNGKLKDNDVNELVNKIKNNIKISKIEDDSINNYIKELKPSDYYLKLNSQDEKIKVGQNFTLDMKDTYIRLWGSSNSYLLGTISTSTNNVNMLQWYDKKWKNGLARIQLLEYPEGSKSGIENVMKAFFGTGTEVKDYNYKNLKIKLAYDTNSSSYAASKGYSNFVGIAFEVDNNVYTIKCSENLKETEISSYIEYLFDNIILINK